MSDLVAAVRKSIERSLEQELHITKSDVRMDLHATVFKGEKLNNHLLKLCKAFKDLKKTSLEHVNPQVHQTCKFLDAARKYYSHFENDFNYCPKNDLRGIYNFYVSRLFLEQQISAQLQRKSPAVAEPQGAKEEETERGLFQLGGGTLGEIWRVSKRLRLFKSQTEKQKSLHRKMYRLVMQIRMMQDEKENIPAEIKVRDRGGMFIPKRSFLSFISTANDLVRKHANHLTFKKNGTSMIKVCVAALAKDPSLWTLFSTALTEEGIDVEECVAVKFFEVWRRKIVHARVNEFIGTLKLSLSKKYKKLEKGALSLRDSLYAKSLHFSRKKKLCSKGGKGKPTNKKLKSVCKKKLPTFKKSHCAKAPLKEKNTCYNNTNIQSTSTSDVRSPVGRTKRIQKKVLLADFIY